MKKYATLIVVLSSLLIYHDCSSQLKAFYGPFPSWVNLKKQYGAVGDGKTDDTKAIQKALNELGDDVHSPVLFLPNGIYRITQPLQMVSRINIAIIGEEPEKTIIRWDGKEGEKMFFLNGVAYSQYSRITWDGNNKALVAYAHEWDYKVNYSNSGSEHSDEIFKNIRVGIKSGLNMDAEMSILRCRFYNCSSTGISLQGWNALDWWIWDCYFDHCNTGISNMHPNVGSGNFNVYRCGFNQSLLSDIVIGNSNFFAFRENISYNSKQFINVSQWNSSSPITIQGNIITTSSTNTMASFFTKGNVLMLDNTFITPDSNKNYVVSMKDNYEKTLPDLAMIGNTFSSKRMTILQETDKFIDIDNRKGIPLTKKNIPKPTPFLPISNCPVYEVNPSMSATTIQEIISKAARSLTKAIIHFSYGRYSIQQTLRIPPNAPLVLMGDCYNTVLMANKDLIKAVVQVEYPTKAIISNMKINGASRVDGILLQEDDLKGNSIYANQLISYHGIESNIWLNSFSSISCRFDNLQHAYSTNGKSLRLTGSGKPSTSPLQVVGGNASSNLFSYYLEKKARMLIEDVWFEGREKHFAELSDESEFVLNGGAIGVNNSEEKYLLNLKKDDGKVILSQLIYTSPGKTIRISENGSSSKFLNLGTWNWNDTTPRFFETGDSKGRFALLNNRFGTNGSYPLANVGDTSREFIVDMLSTLRTTSIKMPNASSSNISDFTLHRVFIEYGINNFRIERVK